MSSGALDRQDILISVCLHGALLLAAFAWTPQLRHTPMVNEPLPIEIVPVSELTRLIRKNEPPPPTPVAEQPPAKAPVFEPKPVQPEPLKQKAQPVPELVENLPIEKPTPEKLAPEKKAEIKPEPLKTELVKPEPPKPVEPPKPLLDLARVQALLDKTPDDPVAPTKETEEVEKMTVSEIDLFKAQFLKCWSFPAGAKNGEDLRVEVMVSMSTNGMVSSGPEVVNREKLGDPYFRAAAESVLRAIKRCQPFRLPVEKYKDWREIKFGFDPRLMLGG